MIILDISRHLLTQISSFSIFLPLAGALIPLLLKRSASYVRPFFIFLLIMGICEYYSMDLYNKGQNNLHIYYFLLILEFVGFSFIFYNNTSSYRFQLLILIAGAFFLSFYLFYTLLNDTIETFNSEIRTLEAINLIIFAMVYLYIFSNEISVRPVNILKTPMFWFSIGILFYFTANFFMFMFYYQIVSKLPRSWDIHSILNVLTNIIFTISFLCKVK